MGYSWCFNLPNASSIRMQWEKGTRFLFQLRRDLPMTIRTLARSGLLAVTVSALLWGCTSNDKLTDVAKKQQLETAHLENFDDLDFNVFSGQKWDQLGKSHAKDVIVHWPDGRTTTGIDVHIEDLKAMFVYAPDTRILEHPVKFGSGEWTSVIGVMEGTFTAPMPVPNGKPILPTGKAFKLTMSTVGRWNTQGTMDEEFLFWDNATYMKQIGLGQ